jgi:26S proteasome regulatory subunit N6
MADLESILRDENQPSDARETALMELVTRVTIQKHSGTILELIELGKKLAGNNKLGLARILKRLLDTVSACDDKYKDIELLTCQNILEWSMKENKAFLKFKLQLRLAGILFDKAEYKRSRELLDLVLKEAKTVDDKQLLIEGHLLESKLIYMNKNWPKAKAALSACRSAANSVYVAPLLQADIETTAGMIHLAERDIQIAYSYFYEGFEAFHQNGQKNRAATNFQYLLLCRIMMDNIEEASNLVTGRFGVLYANDNKVTKTMLLILEAYKEKNLVRLAEILLENKSDIEDDKIISSQIDILYDQLLEKNIVKLITPYSRIEIGYLALKLSISSDKVERKICEMILDEKLKASIDQERGIIIIYEDATKNELFENSAEILKNIDSAVDSLFDRANKLSV